MKQLLVAFLVIVAGMVLGGCTYVENPPLLDEIRGFYETPHKLHRMVMRQEEVTMRNPGQGNLSGGFFLFLGGVQGEYQEGSEATYVSTQIRFFWDLGDNVYTMTTLPLEKIRIRIVDDIDIPTVEFYLNERIINDALTHGGVGRAEIVERDLRAILCNYSNPYEALDKYLEYAIFSVKAEDWPENINFPAIE